MIFSRLRRLRSRGASSTHFTHALCMQPSNLTESRAAASLQMTSGVIFVYGAFFGVVARQLREWLFPANTHLPWPATDTAFRSTGECRRRPRLPKHKKRPLRMASSYLGFGSRKEWRRLLRNQVLMKKECTPSSGRLCFLYFLPILPRRRAVA